MRGHDPMERLTPLAASFLDAEDVDATSSLAIGSLAVFDGPAPAFEDFLEMVRGRLPLVPLYRKKLHRTTLDLTPPAWVDDPHFDLRWHLRRTSLPRPADREQVGRLVSRVMSTRMDRSRPLWEYWFVEGMGEGRWALLSKVHHCMADGISGTDLYRLVLDPTPTPTKPPVDTWQPRPPEPVWSAGARAVRDLATAPSGAVRALAPALAAPASVARKTMRTARGLASLATAAWPVDATSLTGHLDGSRRYTWAEAGLGQTRAARHAWGVSVNDLALAAITGGFRALLMSRGEEPEAHAVRSLVPVSTRARGDEGTTNNQVSLMLPYLPVDIADPLERLGAVHDRIRSLQGHHEPEAGGAVTGIAEHLPFMPVTWGIRLALRLPQRQVATVTTNVPGPPRTLYSMGRELQQMLPYVPIADRVRIGVAIFSYRDELVFGITADADSSPDIDVLARGIEASFAELVDRGGAQAGPAVRDLGRPADRR